MYVVWMLVLCYPQIAQSDVFLWTAEVNVIVKIQLNIVHRNLDYVSLAVIITGLVLDAKVS